MGRTVKILTKKNVPPSLCNRRFTIELCENVHIHYRNIRLEFGKEEFLHILGLISMIDKNEIQNFPYNNYNFKLLVEDFNLPTACEYDHRLQIERQKEGHYHIHYRNCRLEFKTLREIGFNYLNFLFPLFQYRIAGILSKLQYNYLKCYRKKSTGMLLLETLKGKIDSSWATDFVSKKPFYRYYKICSIPLGKLKAVLFVKEGVWPHSLNEAPPFLYLAGDKKAYISYCAFKDSKEGKDRHNVQRFEGLLASIKNSEPFHHLVVVNRKNEILDGLHRACVLLHQYGPDYRITVCKLYFD